MTHSASLPEPSLQDMIEDPIVQLLMARDGVSEESLLPLLQETAMHLQEQPLRRAV